MKPELIDCGNRCKVCDGYGIMTLYAGPEKPLTAPCVSCSPKYSLIDLMARKEIAYLAAVRADEKVKIEEHNRRILSEGVKS